MTDRYEQTHLGEDAELYALGSLSEEERADVDEHLATCSACRRRVGEAEETVLMLERHERSRSTLRTRTATPWAAIAAAFLLGLLPSLWVLFAHAPGRSGSDHDVAIVSMVNSHFGHAQFAPLPAAHAPPAKVVYARDGSWVYVIIAQPRPYVVALRHGTSVTTVGTTHRTRNASELFVRQTYGPVESVYLIDDLGKRVAEARLVTWPRR